MSGKRFEEALADGIAEHGKDLEDDLDLPVSGREFAELLLVGLIKANPISKPNAPSEQQRLADAMRAIFGDTGVRKRADKKDDSELLNSMAHGYTMDRKRNMKPPRSIQALAEKALKDHHCDVDSGMRRLARAFSNRRIELLENLDEPRLMIDEIQSAALHDLQEMLPKFGVKFHSPFF